MTVDADRESEPNPVAEVILARTLPIAFASLAGLLVLRRAVSEDRFRQILRLSLPVVSAGLSAYFLATFDPRTRFPGGRFFTRLPSGLGKNAVALTFDDGPHPESTPRLLDALALAEASGKRASATFFVVADQALQYPSLVRRIVDEGHALGVHGVHHRTMVLDTAARIERDLRMAENAVEDALGAALPTRLFRPPYGFKSWTLSTTTARLGWTTVGWSFDPRDYDGPSEEQIVARFRNRVHSGDIALLHERPGSSAVSDAIPAVVRHCDKLGLACVNLYRLGEVA